MVEFLSFIKEEIRVFEIRTNDLKSIEEEVKMFLSYSSLYLRPHTPLQNRFLT